MYISVMRDGPPPTTGTAAVSDVQCELLLLTVTPGDTAGAATVLVRREP